MTLMHPATLFVIVFILLFITFLIVLRRLRMQATFTLTFDFTPAPQPIAIANSTFTGTQGQPFTGTIDPITGGTPPFTVAGDLSALGLAIDAAGNITGTPTVAGTQTATITVTDSGA